MKARILVVDDDDAVLSAICGVLDSENYTTVAARDGQEAVRLFYQHHIDLVLLDLNMPRKQGWDAFERLSAINPLLPVILITARPDQYPLAAAAGIGALMEKPLDIPRLLVLIDELLAQSPEVRLKRISGNGPATIHVQNPP
ncbi:response regulator [Verrucomicrobiota bacterium sgz303538]